MDYKYTEFLPDYEKCGKAAPIRRNDEIVDYADIVVAIWDGKSKGTKYVIDRCNKIGKSLIIYNSYRLEDVNLVLYDHCDYCNMHTLDNETLKKIITAELDNDFSFEVDTDLILFCIKVMLINKPDVKSVLSAKGILDSLDKDNCKMLKEIIDELD